MESLISGMDSPVRIDSSTTQLPARTTRSQGRTGFDSFLPPEYIFMIMPRGILSPKGMFLRSCSRLSSSVASSAISFTLLAATTLTMSPGRNSAEFSLAHLASL